MRLYTFSQSRNALALAVALLASGVLSGEAAATAFDPNIEINALAELDNLSVPATAGATQAGGFNGIFGGVSASSNVDSALAVTGSSLPLSGALTQLYDGVGMQFSSSAASSNGSFEEQHLYGNYLFQLRNHSGTDTYKISLGIYFDNQQNAFGSADINGAFSRGEMHLFNALNPGVDLFFTDNASDTLFGNAKDGTNLPDFGGLVKNSGFSTLDLLLSPGATILLEGFNDLSGSSEDTVAGYSGLLNSFVSVENVVDVTNAHAVPSPTSLWLLLSGFISLRVLGRRNAGQRVSL